MKIFLTMLIILISSSLSAATINFCSQERADLSNKDGTGYYWDLLRAAYEIEGAEITHSAVPFVRCLSMVENKLVDVAVAAFQTQERVKKFTYPQSRLHFSNYGITLLKQTQFDQVDNLKGQVGLIRGYDFSAWLPAHLDIFPVGDTIQAIKMLKLKRIKYHADDIQDVLLALRKIGGQPEDFVMKTISTRNLYVVFTKDARGQKLANMFDSGIRKIAENGTLEKIVNKYKLTHSILIDF
ncbi:MAG: hypothetical protein OFPI_37690 [Osedax symbiont Rs2]|nr:MAG: hypothetical protein OFPI_37690 [Osedax symbiont Rs2]